MRCIVLSVIGVGNKPISALITFLADPQEARDMLLFDCWQCHFSRTTSLSCQHPFFICRHRAVGINLRCHERAFIPALVMRGLGSPTKSTIVLLVLTVLAASSTCFLFFGRTKPPPPIKRPALLVRPSEPVLVTKPPPPVKRPAQPQRFTRGHYISVFSGVGSVTNPQIKIQLSSGDEVPESMAVQVRPRDQGPPDWSQAKWIPYSSNVAVDLGDRDGRFTVWINAGWPDGSSDGTGEESLATLVRTPLVIAVTNPPSLVTPLPVIQLLGYGERPLASIRFDVINESGTYTERDTQGFVYKQDFDSTSWEFTTNYFFCCDIGLTRGTNTIVPAMHRRRGDFNHDQFALRFHDCRAN